MKKIIKDFMRTDIDNLVWGFFAAVAIASIAYFTDSKEVAATGGGTLIGICLNKMRGKNGNSEEPEPTITETSEPSE
jgi:hypothetical protein